MIWHGPPQKGVSVMPPAIQSPALRDWEVNVQRGSGVASASVLAMVLAGVVSGAIVGPVLGSLLANQLVLAIVCAFVGAILALVIGNVILGDSAEFTLPSGVVVWNVIIASLIGGLAGDELSVDLSEPPVSPLIGALAGVLAGILMASFVITIFMLRNRLSVHEGGGRCMRRPLRAADDGVTRLRRALRINGRMKTGDRQQLLVASRSRFGRLGRAWEPVSRATRPCGRI